MKKSSGKEDAPIGTPPRPNRAEPTTWSVSGSVVHFPAVGKYLTEKIKRSVNGCKTYRDPSKTDNSPAGKEKARERSELELGASEASIGGRAQWVKRSERASERQRHCGAGWLR